MFSNDDFNSAIVSAKDQLRAVEAALNDLSCPEIHTLTVNLRELSHERIEELLEDVPTGYAKKDKATDFVYIIQVSDQDAAKTAQLKALLEESRKAGNDYSRVHQRNEESQTLYVGRSKTFRARLRQHLGTGDQGVFSLHLQRWATSVDVDITIYFMAFLKADDLLVQAVEDGIWDFLKPAFGRQGEL